MARANATLTADGWRVEEIYSPRLVAVPANTAAVLGDSITENNTYTNANSVSHGQRGYLTWANALLGTKRMELLNNAGVSGETTSQILARVRSDVIAYSPSWCIVHAGINDLAGSLLGLSVVTDNLRQIYTQLLNAGIRVVATSIMPVGSTHTNWSQQLHARICAVNQWIAAYAAETPGMVFCDFYGVVTNPTDASANPRSGYYWDTPAVHPSALGAYYLGKALRDVLSPFLYPCPPLNASVVNDWAADVQTITTLTGTGTTLTATLAAHKLKVGDVVTISGANEAGFNGQREVLTVPGTGSFTMAGTGSGTATGTVVCSGSTNLLDEGLFQGSGGTGGTGVTGTVATGWTVDRVAGTPTAACTVDARSDGIGNDQTIVVTSGANGDWMQLRAADVPARAFIGESVYAECEVTVSSITAMNLLQLQLETIDAGSTSHTFDGGHGDFTDAFPTEGYTALLRTPVKTFTGAVTRLRLKVGARFSGAGGATIKVGRARVVKVLPA